MGTENNKYSLDSLVEVMEVLRGKDGCPWDKAQTHVTIKKYLIEETYEVLDAIDEKNMHKLCEELGDLLLQIVFHAQLAQEKGYFNINDVINSVTEKMIRRHPHVFKGEHADTPEQVLVKWEEIKARESDEPKPLLDVPRNFPALYRAQKIQTKAARVGFDWPDINGAWDKVQEEITELEEAILAGEGEKEELGDALFALVNLARFLHTDAEESLQETIKKFIQRFSHVEQQAESQQVDLRDMSLEFMDRLWNEAKKGEKNKGKF